MIHNYNSEENDRGETYRALFFDKQVYMDVWKEAMAGKNEEKVISTLEGLGYKLGTDFERQYPIAERYVIDIAFPKEKVALEVDGNNHREARQKNKDKIRDRYLREHKWVTIRIPDNEFFGFKGSYYKWLIKEVLDERREQYQNGDLYDIDFTRFKESDYE